MSYKTTAIFFCFSFILFLLERFVDIDLLATMFTYHRTTVGIMLPILFFTGIGLSVDYVQYILRKKEDEKDMLYRQTVFGMNHLIRGLQSKFVILTESDVVKKEFGNELIELLNQSSKNIEGILDTLTMLHEIDSEIVKNILAPHDRCNICGAERLNVPHPHCCSSIIS